MRVSVRFELLATSDGGLKQPLPSPTRSLLVHLDLPSSEGSGDFGAHIETGTQELVPGARFEGVAEFWADVADAYVIPGVAFELRYPRRVVGRGQVLDVLTRDGGSPATPTR